MFWRCLISRRQAEGDQVWGFEATEAGCLYMFDRLDDTTIAREAESRFTQECCDEVVEVSSRLMLHIRPEGGLF